MRVDLNVPMQDGEITEDSRIQKVIPTIQYLLDRGAAVILMSHLGRPKGQVVEELRLDPVAKKLSKLLQKKVQKTNETIGEKVNAKKEKLFSGEILLLENTRFHPEEVENDYGFAKELATHVDLFVQEAFGTAHRAHASTQGIMRFLPSYIGFLIDKEVEMLGRVMESPDHPLTVVMGGAKIDTKIGVIRNFFDIADQILIGGGLANTFLAAQGYEIGKSLYQADKMETARQILQEAQEKNVELLIPEDIVVAEEISEKALITHKNIKEVQPSEKILDIGPVSAEKFSSILLEAKMIIWNGPMGLFEYTPFLEGTKRVADAIRAANAVTLLGGGDTIKALTKLHMQEDNFTHVSTGGGAMLEFLEGKNLPGMSQP